MSSISIYFSAFLEDFSYEIGVKNPCRTVGLNRAGETPHKKIHSLWNRHLACSCDLPLGGGGL